MAHRGGTNGSSPWLDRVMQIFALFMLCGIFTSQLIPETKGKTLEELTGEDDGKSGSEVYELRFKSRFYRADAPNGGGGGGEGSGGSGGDSGEGRRTAQGMARERLRGLRAFSKKNVHTERELEDGNSV